MPAFAAPIGWLGGSRLAGVPLPAVPAPADREHGVSAPLADRWVRGGLYALLVSILFLPRFGLNLGEFSASVSLLVAYGVLAVFAARGRLMFSPPMLLGYAACMTVAALSLLVNGGFASVNLSSPTSLLLLGVMYLPFVMRLRPVAGEPDLFDWTLRQFLAMTFVIALAGIAQYYLQYFIKGQWLFDFTHRIPEVLRGPSGYNTVIEVEQGHKSNGFFQREPSGFSFLMAVGLMLEWQRARRPLRIACYALALALSYSGTGVLALCIGALFPLGSKTLVRVAVIALVAAVAFALLDNVLNLSFTLARLDEFGSERSSAYIRYVAPAKLLAKYAAVEPWGIWLGYGPGSVTRVAATVPFEYHDPTWAKLLFEYGVLGLLAIGGLIVTTIGMSAQQVRIKAVLIASWLIMGGHLLTADIVFLDVLLIGLWACRPRQGDSVDLASDSLHRLRLR